MPGTEKIVYEVTHLDLDEFMTRQAEEKIFNRFEARIVNSFTACDVLGISMSTLHRYIKAGLLEPETRAIHEDIKFRLSYLLKINVSQLQKKLRYENRN